MRVFILSTGRCGSTAVYKACSHIENYSAGHESLVHELGIGRFKYPQHHIESDNRLSWHVGQLDSIFGDDAFYVHLKRNREDVANSFMKRFNRTYSVIDAFCGGIRKKRLAKLTESEKLQACHDYITTVNTNIEFFMEGKSKKTTLILEKIETDFPIFWEKIGAKGNLSMALKEFEFKHNSS